MEQVFDEIQQNSYINFNKALNRIKSFGRFKKQIVCFQPLWVFLNFIFSGSCKFIIKPLDSHIHSQNVKIL